MGAYRGSIFHFTPKSPFFYHALRTPRSLAEPQLPFNTGRIAHHVGAPWITKLPVEVWERCWGHCQNRHLRRLTLVCRLFRDICQRLLFFKQIFRAPYFDNITPLNWMHVLDRIVTSSLRLQHVRESRHISSVQHLAFLGSFELDVSWMFPKAKDIEDLNRRYLSAVREFSTTLYRYHQLCALHLSNLTIGVDLRQALCELPKLVELTLADCDIAWRNAPLLPLKRLSISGALSEQTGINYPLPILSPRSLQALRLQNSPDGDSVLYAFAPGEAFHQLVDLQISLTAEIVPRFFAFLLDCPCLRHIAILSAPTSIPQNLPPSAIPHLSSFCGPISLVEPFVCNRPVDTIELTYPSGARPADPVRDITLVLHRIAQSSVPLTSLTLPPIPPDISLFFTISNLFPRLLELNIDIWEPREYEPMSADDEPSDTVNDALDFCEQCDDYDSDGEEQFVSHETITVDYVSIRVPSSENSPIAPKIVLNSKGCPDRPPTSFAALMDWLCTGYGSDFPPDLKVLSIRQLDPQFAPFTVPQQRRAVVELSRRIPYLGVVGFAAQNNWTLEDGLWVGGHDGYQTRRDHWECVGL
ncbi:hypothetical protein FB451DRAFT_278193 [Mycena latifolia]|nr:hypothetical protein FB451DRAFT_278193 [Mycena latifolia]